ncbi:Conserved_hypothetical protein [Hexamita inflata]|uniref:Uncharacterized protein n=1 Tax=Hexamita inflata TaxID=28002 RepID=A0AA86URX3_9EUKA|nr:Conserved hypothetical protein [Hexamita inflata]
MLISSSKLAQLSCISSEVYSLTPAQLDAEIKELELLKQQSVLNRHDVDICAYLNQLVLDLASLSQLPVNSITPFTEFNRHFDAYKDAFTRFTSTITAFMETYTGFKQNLTAFQPDISFQLQNQSELLTNLVKNQATYSLQTEERQKFQFCYSEAMRVHTQISKLRTTENQLQQIINAEQFRKEFQKTEQNCNESMIQNELEILQQLQDEHIEANANYNQAIQQEFEIPIAKQLDFTLRKINQDLELLCTNLRTTHDFVHGCLEQVTKIVQKLGKEFQQIEEVADICQQQLIQLNNTQEIIQKIIVNVMNQIHNQNELKTSPIALLNIDKVFEPFGDDKPKAVIQQIQDVVSDQLNIKIVRGTEEVAENKQNKILYQKGQLLQAFKELNIEDTTEKIIKDVEEHEKRAKSMM